MLNKLAIFVDRSQYGTPNQLYVIETSVFRSVHRGENRVKYRLNNMFNIYMRIQFLLRHIPLIQPAIGCDHIHNK